MFACERLYISQITIKNVLPVSLRIEREGSRILRCLADRQQILSVGCILRLAASYCTAGYVTLWLAPVSYAGVKEPGSCDTFAHESAAVGCSLHI